MKDSLYCPRCGAQNPAQAPACVSCRKSLLDPPAASRTQAQTPMPATKRAPAVAVPAPTPAPQPTYRPTRPARSRNFIIRHWRGEYSLGVSYWLIAGALSLLLVMASSAVREVSEMHHWGLQGQGALILAYYLLRPAVAVWQLVGLIRSALAHRDRGGRSIWAVLVLVMATLSGCGLVYEVTVGNVPNLREGFKMIRGIDDVPGYTLRLQRNGTELAVTGGLQLGVADAVERALQGAPAVRILRLDSSEGRAGEATQLARLITERRLATYTSGTCARACVLAYLAGHPRYLGEQGRIGFHGAQVSGVAVSGAADVDGSVAQALRNVGAPEPFIDQVGILGDELWFPDAQALKGTKVIDAQVSGADEDTDKDGVQAEGTAL